MGWWVHEHGIGANRMRSVIGEYRSMRDALAYVREVLRSQPRRIDVMIFLSRQMSAVDTMPTDVIQLSSILGMTIHA